MSWYFVKLFYSYISWIPDADETKNMSPSGIQRTKISIIDEATEAYTVNFVIEDCFE